MVSVDKSLKALKYMWLLYAVEIVCTVIVMALHVRYLN